jgi:protein TonB
MPAGLPTGRHARTSDLLWSDAPKREHLLSILGIVSLAHGALLGWMLMTQHHELPPVTLPMVFGQLVSQAPADTRPSPTATHPSTSTHSSQARAHQASPLLVSPHAAPADWVAESPLTLPDDAPHTVAEVAPPPSPHATAMPSGSTDNNSEALTPPRSDAGFLNNPAPVYPAVSRRFHEQGLVLLDVHIQPDGRVSEIRLKHSSGFTRLDDAALDAVRQWRYLPARRGDKAIPFWYVQPVDFALK